MTDAPPTFAELAALYAEDDRLRAEHEQWMAQRETRASPAVRETVLEGVMTHGSNGNALLAAPAAEAVAFDEEPWAFDELQMDVIAQVLKELREEFDERIAHAEKRILQATVRLALPGELAEREVHELRARVIRAEEKIERQLKAAIADDDNVFELPNWRRKGVA